MADTSLTKEKKSFFKDKANLFVIQVLLVYVGWKVIYYFLSKPNSDLHQSWLSIVDFLGTKYAAVASNVLNVFGEQTTHKGPFFYYTNTGKSILVAEHCLAIPAIIVFSFSVVLFTGSWKNKIWFIPLGVVGICFINLLRLIMVGQAFNYLSSMFYYFHHSIIYVAITYGLIFGMIVWWMKKFGSESKAG